MQLGVVIIEQEPESENNDSESGVEVIRGTPTEERVTQLKIPISMNLGTVEQLFLFKFV